MSLDSVTYTSIQCFSQGNNQLQIQTGLPESMTNPPLLKIQIIQASFQVSSNSNYQIKMKLQGIENQVPVEMEATSPLQVLAYTTSQCSVLPITSQIVLS